MVVRSRIQADMLARVDDLVAELKTAGERFDQGRTLEARAVARHIGRLVHTSAASRALIDELGVGRLMTWVDTAGVVNPKTAASAACLTLMKIRTGSARCGEFVPKLGMYPPAPIRTRDGAHIDRGSRIPFEHWWTNPVVKDADGAEFSRKQLVLALAGDSADDIEAAAALAALAGSPSLSSALCGDPAAGGLERNPVMASARQIGYEVLQSISQQRDIIAACA
ncbi:hypothetical protein FK535_19495 [Mycolicibacterium sp. 018/SC-01/001]|uniref:hypothetical protein n=1 Tax=Mycolicibacterium sp. 018/SC-01/001 TaxID=2592069 RepID=UPI0011814057|nr:hypothetical protein [Mycolicibacterium sp. 018/SC-01/001]TRW80526.1 hypothetical protein FK535_19495 [Mycolicibacterium sp. 018/SC-01/001]